MQNNRKLIYGILIAFFILEIVLFLIIWHGKNKGLRVIFLDVGQGDSILIAEGCQQILIDGGKDGKLLLEKLGKYIPFWDRNIEAIIETHPDQDHIGGLIAVMASYGVDSILKTRMQSDSQTFKKLEEEVEINRIEKIEAKKGVKIKFASGATAEILYPLELVVNADNKDTNSASVVVKLAVGESKFLLTGDFPTTEDDKILGTSDLEADFLKVSHHGSKYASSKEFLSRVEPTDAIISVGKNNSYGHPNSEVTQRLLQQGVNIFRTDEIGDIIYECQNLKSKCQMLAN